MDAAGSSRNQVIKVKLLLEAGADPSLGDNEGHSAAERERNSSDAELLALLDAS